MPLHCTVHHDGWAKGDGSSPRSGIHAKMDALPGQLGMESWEVARDLEPVAVPDLWTFVLAAIEGANKRVDRVYGLEAKLPPGEGPLAGEPDAAVRTLAMDCCRSGALLTATVWYSAWTASAKIELPAWYKRAAPAGAKPEVKGEK
jgi:hypothetical protein